MIPLRSLGIPEGLCASWLARSDGFQAFCSCAGRSTKVKPMSCGPAVTRMRGDVIRSSNSSRATGVLAELIGSSDAQRHAGVLDIFTTMTERNNGRRADAVGEGVAAADLPQPGQPGRALDVVDDVVAVAGELLDHHRPRADQAHLAAQHVDQLRQLVERGAPQPGAA